VTVLDRLRNDIYFSGGGIRATLCNSSHWPLSLSYRRLSSSGRVGAGSGTMVIEVVGSGQHHAVDQLWATARDLPNVHGARWAINPLDMLKNSFQP